MEEAEEIEEYEEAKDDKKPLFLGLFGSLPAESHGSLLLLMRIGMSPLLQSCLLQY
jgi:hypothetical protein